MPDRPTAHDAYDGASGARRADPPSSGARYTLDAARDAGYRALERFDAEMALVVAPDARPGASAGGHRAT
jgi:hypothetical protein